MSTPSDETPHPSGSPLARQRPVWDIVVISFSVGGLALSLTGVVIGIRRLRIHYS